MKFCKIVSFDFYSSIEFNLKCLTENTSYGTISQLRDTQNQFYRFRDIAVAVDDFFNTFNPFFGIDCRLAMIFAIYKSMIDFLGNEKFNYFITKSLLKNPFFDISSFHFLDHFQCKVDEKFEFFQSSHLYYLRGHKDYLKYHPHGEWQGHWVVCVSESPPLFVGYQLNDPISLRDLTDLFIDHSNKNINPPICLKEDFDLSVLDHYDLTKLFKIISL